MAKNKTAATKKSVVDFILAIRDETKRDDSHQLIHIMRDLTGSDPVMWGPSIIGFGTYHYKTGSGHEGDMPVAAFSPRNTTIVVYLSEFDKKEQLLKKLGKHKASKGCVYFKKLQDIDVAVLKKLIAVAMKSVVK